MKKLLVADDKIPFLHGALEKFAAVQYLPGDKISHEDVKLADALITRTRTQCNAKLLENTNVQLVATATIGYDHIDTTWCELNGVRWVNAPGCNSNSVKQYVTAAIVTVAQQRNRRLDQMTLGVVGVGNV
jgi:erythronate-4-phosphate dehydrogenase